MQRNKWEFPYPADKLLEAAQTKKDFHSARHDTWRIKQKETEDKIRAEGIEIDESVMAGDPAANSTYSNSYRPPGVQIRTDLLSDMQECVGKVAEHRNKIKEYDAWIQVLQSQGQAAFPLEQDDWLFFFGH